MLVMPVTFTMRQATSRSIELASQEEDDWDDQVIKQAHNTLEMDPHFAISYQVLGEAYLSKGKLTQLTGRDRSCPILRHRAGDEFHGRAICECGNTLRNHPSELSPCG